MYLILVVGHTQQGKTTFLNTTFLKNGVKKNPLNPTKNLYYLTAESKNQYIFDVNNEYELPTDKAGMQAKCRHTDCDIKIFTERCRVIKNYNVVIEDATGFLRGKQSAEFARLLTGKVHNQNNYIILFHSLNRVPPELMEMANYVALFKTSDNADIVDRKFKNQNLNNAFAALQREKQYSKRIIQLI